MKIWLDDERDAPDGWVRTRTVAGTIAEYLWNISEVEEISLDHDLGLDEYPGYDFLRWMEQFIYITHVDPPKLHVHTANPPARKRMEAAVASIQRLVDEH